MTSTKPQGAIMAFLIFVGEVSLLFWDSVVRLFRGRFEWRETIHQMSFVGVSSIPIVAMTCFFSGGVLSLYLSTFLRNYSGTAFVGATVALSVTREVAPVLAGIMVAARCGSAMAAQIGTMAVTEQLDALRMLSVHPTNYLVTPRIIASVLMIPMLALVGMYSGIGGGLLVAMAHGVPQVTFMQSVSRFCEPSDFILGMMKGPTFGLIIALVACQQGMATKNGAVGVGRATTNTVVISMVLVYVANFLLAGLFFG